MSGIGDIAFRAWDNLTARPGGPYGFRFLLQPAMAMIFAIRDGFKDAGAGRSAYVTTIVKNPAKRSGRLKEGLRSIWKIMALALVLDALYQITEFRTFYPGEAIVVVVVLAIMPYLLLRGPTMRLVRWWRNRCGSDTFV